MTGEDAASSSGTIQRLRGFLQVVRMRMLGSQILVHWRARRCWCLWPNCCAKSNFARLSPLPPLSKEQEEQAAASPATALCFLLCLCWPDCHWASFDSSQPPAQYVSSSDQICVRTVSSRGHLLGWSRQLKWVFGQTAKCKLCVIGQRVLMLVTNSRERTRTGWARKCRENFSCGLVQSWQRWREIYTLHLLLYIQLGGE